jgi:NAD(P)-dependent dehydrogenase (short-subunit alcohol dehydrogenase family)
MVDMAEMLANRTIREGRLSGKVALITGAGSGIGAETARLFDREGAFVVAVGDHRENIEAVTAELSGDSAAIVADVSDPDAVAKMAKETLWQFGRIDVLVNNAGIIFSASIVETEPDDWERVFAVNVRGVYLCTRAVLPGMLAQAHGSIINMASVAGLGGTGGGAAYIAAKHAVVGLTRQMAVVYSPRGITVNCVCPGAIPTGLRANSQAILGPDMPDMSQRGVAVNDDQLRALVPIGQRGTAQDVANAVCFLASDEASYVTGHTLVVDGGWRAK